MKVTYLVVLFSLTVSSCIFAAEYSGVTYEPPSGWNQQTTNQALAFTPPNLSEQNGIAIALSIAQDLGTLSLSDWLNQQMNAELAGGKVLSQADPIKEEDGALHRITIARIVQDPQGNATIQMYHAISDDKKVALAVAISTTQQAATSNAQTIRQFFGSMNFNESAPSQQNSGEINIAGEWSTTSYFGELVDRSTGSFEASAYSGEWYQFRADGSYTYSIVASGNLINGATIENGTYQIVSNHLALKRKTQSFFPMPGRPNSLSAYKDKPSPADYLYPLNWKDANTISIQSPNTGTWTDFHRKH